MVDTLDEHNPSHETLICVGLCSEFRGNVLCVPAKNPSAKPISCDVARMNNPGLGGFGVSGVPESIVPGTPVYARRMGNGGSYTIESVQSSSLTTTEGATNAAEGSPQPTTQFQVLGKGDVYAKSVTAPWTAKTALEAKGVDASKAGFAAAVANESKIMNPDAGEDQVSEKDKPDPLKNRTEKSRLAGKKDNLPKTVGDASTRKGSIKDPTAFIKKVLGKKGEMIPNAFKMMENLKKAAKSGSPINAASAVGGAALIRKALAGITKSQSEQQGTEDEEDFFCTLFKELFPDFECRIDNQETEVFRKWKIDYLAALQDEEEPMA